jgi:gas vesicle protein
MNSGKLLLGVLAGVAVGATLGILFAPDKGTATRKKLSQKGQDYAEELTNKFNEFIGSISKKFETVKEDAIGIAEKVKSKAGEAAMDGSTARN